MSNKSIALTAFVTIIAWYVYFTASALSAAELEEVVVIFPDTNLIANLSPDTAVVSINSWSITLISPKPDLAKSLFGIGEWIVFPAEAIGCRAGSTTNRT